MAKKTMVAIIMCAVMTLVAAAPMVLASTHLVLKGDQGPRASAVTWEYVPVDYGVWTGHIVNNGLRSLLVDVYDNTTGVPDQIMHQRIRFAAVGAYPTGEVDSAGVVVSPTHRYSITVTPSGPRGASCTVDDPFTIPPLPPVAVFNWSVSERQTISVDGSGSYDPDGVIASYDWDFGDGWNATGMAAIHIYAAAGNYIVTLKVTDHDGMVGLANKSVQINPPPPIWPVFTYHVEGLTVIVDASASSDPDGTIVSYVWTWGDGTNGSGKIATHSYAVSGNYTITLTMTDIFGRTYSLPKVVTVTQGLEPPVAMFVATVSHLTVAFDGSASYDLDGPIVAYDWDFGDGASATGMATTHTYAAYGTYQITLTVTDNDGLTGSMTRDLTWGTIPLPPVANFTVVVDDLTVNVDGSGSYDPDGVIVSYAWAFGDGSTAIGRTATHTYAALGYYTITLTVTDNDGLSGSMSKIALPPPVLPPVAKINVSVNWMTVYVDGSSSYDVDGTIVAYHWDFGDGLNATGVIATHTYSEPGIYTITLTVTNNHGVTGSTCKEISAVSRGDTLPFAMFAVFVDGMSVFVNGSESYDVDGQITSYSWDFGDGSTGSGMTATHSYATPGVYTITLVVVDNDGLTGSVSREVTLS